METLPPDIIREICPYLNWHTLVKFYQTSHNIHSIVEYFVSKDRLCRWIYVNRGYYSHPRSIHIIKKMNLNSRALRYIPPEFSYINARKLNLHDNKLSEVSLGIYQMTNLTKLVLCKNKINHISPDIKKLINLQQLYLEHNNLRKIPSEIYQLTNLSTLELHYNKLVFISPNIIQLKKLERITLDNNELVTHPIEMNNFKNLQYITLHNNKTKLKYPGKFKFENSSSEDISYSSDDN